MRNLLRLLRGLLTPRMGDREKPGSVSPAAASATAATTSPIIVSYQFLAQDWFNDARWEAENPLAKDNWHYRRREVVFAVLFAETYLFEWTLAKLLLDGDKLLRYFPADDKRGVTNRWAEVPAQLLAHGLLARPLPESSRHTENWERLIAFRNGLMHAKASWPNVVGKPTAHPPPSPKLHELSQRPPGWAVQVATERVKRLHEAAETPMPAWIIHPPAFVGCPSCQRS